MPDLNPGVERLPKRFKAQHHEQSRWSPFAERVVGLRFGFSGGNKSLLKLLRFVGGVLWGFKLDMCCCGRRVHILVDLQRGTLAYTCRFGLDRLNTWVMRIAVATCLRRAKHHRRALRPSFDLHQLQYELRQLPTPRRLWHRETRVLLRRGEAGSGLRKACKRHAYSFMG